MQLANDSEMKETRVRVIIGKTKGSGIQAPTKSILVIDTSVEEVYNMLIEEIKKRRKKK